MIAIDKRSCTKKPNSIIWIWLYYFQLATIY
jgi:hypothetical protein